MTTDKSYSLNHAECELLLPSYINSQLSSEKQRAVQEHIAHCERCFRAQQEAQNISDLIQKNPESLDELLRPSNIEKNLQKTMAMIEDTTSTVDSVSLVEKQPELPTAKPIATTITTKSNVHFLQRCRQQWQQMPLIPKGVMVAQAAALVIAVTVLWDKPETVSSPNLQGYQTLSEPKTSVATDYETYRIVFNPDVPEKQMRLLMTSLQAQMISGPSIGGVYTITTPATESRELSVLPLLRSNPWIKLAEQAIHQDNASTPDRTP